MRAISLKAARVSADLTQKEIAEKLGVTRKSVQNWEKGRTNIKKAHLIAYCAVTGFTPDDIFLPTVNP